MGTHSVMLRGETHDEWQMVSTLGRVLSRYCDALPDRLVTSLMRDTYAYDGTLTMSPAFTLLDRLCGPAGVVWTLADDGTFEVTY